MHAAITERLPDLDLPIVEATTAELSSQLLINGQLDVAMMAVLPGMTERYHVAPLFHEPFHAALPQGHRLADVETIDPLALADEHLLLLDEGHCLADQAAELCQLRQAPRSGPRYRATSLETVRHLVTAGHGVTVLPALAAAQPRPEEAIRPLAGDAGRDIALVWRRNDPRGDAYPELQTVIRRHAPRGIVQPN